jgi:hypothetical protein
MLRSKRPALYLPRLGKRSQFLLFETFALIFGVSACQLFGPSSVRWAALIPCIVGGGASFLMVLTTRCEACNEPVGREAGRLVAVPHTHCSRCGSDLR